ncbi:MAG: zinc-ribbon domain-containing protein [Lachnospiraceae bacterium]|nr:zinc-ribbon domain-containing protein [Lachnospiraceae bacterium]
MAFCKNCGNKLKDGAAFCINCGFKVGDKMPVQMPRGNVHGMMPENNYADEPEMAELLRDIAVGKAREVNDRFQEWLPGAKENAMSKYRNFKDKLAEERNQLMERRNSSQSRSSNAVSIKYCSQCGAQNSEEYAFCIQCGAPLE